jgi:cholesterol transport system auxiliary component
MKSLVIVLTAAILAACSAPGPREADRYFLLEAGATALAQRTRPALVVAPTTAATFYDTQDIAYSRAPGTRGYYQFNHWTERPQRSIHRQLASRLEGTGAKAALRLQTQLEEIYHDATEQPGTAHITIRAELVNAADGTVLARRTFTRFSPASSYDAPGAVRGFNQALAALLDEIGAWIDVESRRPTAPVA